MPIRLKVPKVSKPKELVDCVYWNYGLTDGIFISILRFNGNEIKMRIDECVARMWGFDNENIGKRRFTEECKILWGYDLNLGKATFPDGVPNI